MMGSLQGNHYLMHRYNFGDLLLPMNALLCKSCVKFKFDIETLYKDLHRDAWIRKASNFTQTVPNELYLGIIPNA